MRRHSAAHLTARAVCNLFPGTQTDIGPATDDGFYYDFDLEHRLAPEDFPALEKEIARLIALDEPFVRAEMARPDVAARLAGQKYKLERLADIPEGETISTYEVGDYFEMCRGPHVEHSAQIGAVKLMKVAGSYYRGDENNKMLQRVYGIVGKDQAELDAYVARLEEAKKRDHRRLGVELDLFHLDPEDPGQIFWHPKGWTIYVALQDYMRAKLIKDGYQEVNTPAIMPRSLWERSGHWDHYKANMFVTESEKRVFAVKPMNCPGALEIFKSRMRSYKDLPLRLAEFGHCARNEPSGTLHSATARATSRAARCTASCACAGSCRTTRTSSAPRSRSRRRSRSSAAC